MSKKWRRPAESRCFCHKKTRDVCIRLAARRRELDVEMVEESRHHAPPSFTAARMRRETSCFLASERKRQLATISAIAWSVTCEMDPVA